MDSQFQGDEVGNFLATLVAIIILVAIFTVVTLIKDLRPLLVTSSELLCFAHNV
jgi:hypothetical protein